MSDSHYRKMKIEPCDVVIDRVSNPGDLSSSEAYYVAKAIEYLMRAGRKPGNPGMQDVEKAEACLRYAMTGRWHHGE
jgi:hypothetical protein